MLFSLVWCSKYQHHGSHCIPPPSAAFGAAMVSNSPGTVVDISDHQFISVGMSLWSVAPLNGPVTGVRYTLELP